MKPECLWLKQFDLIVIFYFGLGLVTYKGIGYFYAHNTVRNKN